MDLDLVLGLGLGSGLLILILLSGQGQPLIAGRNTEEGGDLVQHWRHVPICAAFFRVYLSGF